MNSADISVCGGGWRAEINGEVEQKRFLWQGLRMLREETPGQSILYLYEPSKLNRDSQQQFTYDDGDRLLSIERHPSSTGKQLGVTEEKLEYTYDLLGRLTREITPDGTLGYEYDPLSNLSTLTLPDGRKVNHLTTAAATCTS